MATVEFKDFVRQAPTENGFEFAMDRMNQFLANNPHVRLINIETLVAPGGGNIHIGENGYGNPSLRAVGVRLWFYGSGQ